MEVTVSYLTPSFAASYSEKKTKNVPEQPVITQKLEPKMYQTQSEIPDSSTDRLLSATQNTLTDSILYRIVESYNAVFTVKLVERRIPIEYNPPSPIHEKKFRAKSIKPNFSPHRFPVLHVCCCYFCFILSTNYYLSRLYVTSVLRYLKMLISSPYLLTFNSQKQFIKDMYVYS
jgi:hypothetical protein